MSLALVAPHESVTSGSKLSAVGKLRSGKSSGSKLSVNAEKFIAIDADRARRFITQAALARAAGISPRWYYDLIHHPWRVRTKTVLRLRAALRQLTTPAQSSLLRKGDIETLISTTYNAFLAQLAAAMGANIVEVRAQLAREGQCTADKDWRAASHVRQAAIYLTNTALGVPQFRLARALDLTAAAVCLAIRAVEDRRDDASFDAVLTQTEILVTGRE